MLSIIIQPSVEKLINTLSFFAFWINSSKMVTYDDVKAKWTSLWMVIECWTGKQYIVSSWCIYMQLNSNVYKKTHTNTHINVTTTGLPWTIVCWYGIHIPYVYILFEIIHKKTTRCILFYLIANFFFLLHLFFIFSTKKYIVFLTFIAWGYILLNMVL